ncbi:MAG TPA: acetaldehyde dehydrogenase (acetylating) [Dehalococcoidia bacterium]|nr:acetaldehyde dehydrogenase (acetylating) [Dehalococcoidia bacterium]
MGKLRCAIVGTGNIGTDLMLKLRRSELLELVLVVGIDPQSEGLALARRLGYETSVEGIEGFRARCRDLGVELAFEATSARVHAAHAPIYRELGVTAVDLTPAALGPLVIPYVNIGDVLSEPNLNLGTCGAQATVPIVAAIASVAPVPYAEIVSTIASKSAGPGTRQNIDEFTRTTARALVQVGGAQRGKAIIVLNPAEPPILMRNTVYAALDGAVDREAVAAAIEETVARVQGYVPGYRLKVPPVFDEEKVTVFLEVEGAGDYLPPYAGNLDIMTAAAVRVGEEIARRRLAGAEARRSGEGAVNG